MGKAGDLERSAEWYSSGESLSQGWLDIDDRLLEYMFRTFSPWLSGDSCLEFGTADGDSTRHLLERFARVVAVEGAERFVDIVRERFASEVEAGKLVVAHALFEEFTTAERFDVLLATHVLEHLDDPVAFLRTSTTFLEEEGYFLILVPNAGSIHRLAAAKMRLLEEPNSLSPQDVSLGHQRVYSWDELERDLLAADLEIVARGGLFLKPLTNQQISESWTPAMIDAFYELGRDLPELAAEIYAVCRRSGERSRVDATITDTRSEG